MINIFNTNSLKLVVCLITIRLLFQTNFASSFPNQSETSKYKFVKLDLPLNSNRVECIYEDSYGFLWIGTLGGLHRFDGTEVKIYLPSKEFSSLNVSGISQFLEDSQGRFWIGTEDGIFLYNRAFDNFKEFKFEEFADISKSTSNIVESVFEDQNQKIWIGSERVGLQYLNEETQQFEAFFEQGSDYSMAKTRLASATSDLSGNIWMATQSKGLVKINTQSGSATHFLNDPENEEVAFQAFHKNVFIDRKNRVWVTYNGDGIKRADLNDSKLKFTHYRHDKKDEHSLYNNDVVNIYEDSQGRIWICNENGGLHLYDETLDSFHRLLPDPGNTFSISTKSIRVVYEDSKGRFWVGSHLSGVEVFDKNIHKFEHYFHSENVNSLSNDIVRCIYEDKNGILWVGTDGGGLNKIDRANNHFTAFRSDPENLKSIASKVVLSIEEDHAGRLWLGTWGAGIVIFDPLTGEFNEPFPNMHSTNKVYQIYRDSKNNIWAGTYKGGINVINENGKFLFNIKNDPEDWQSLSNNSVIAILEDSKGKYWFCTENYGINVSEDSIHKNMKFKRYAYDSKDSSSIPNVKINHIYEDSNQHIWVASEGGLSKYLPESDNFLNYSNEHGLGSDNVKAIVEDEKGFLWLSTSNGLSKFDPTTQEFQNYTSADGLQSGEFSRYSVYKTRNHEFIFGGNKGFNIFIPDSLKINPIPPKVYITVLKLFNTEVSWDTKNSPLSKVVSMTDHISLAHGQSVITFEFVGISFTKPEMNQYAYRMIGFDEKWNEVGSQRQATYTNLDPGTYDFQVKASNNDGVWSSEYGQIQLTILPAWWQTWWFKASIVLICLLVIYSIYRIRLAGLKKSRNQLQTQVKIRTEEIENQRKQIEQDALALKMKNAELELKNETISNQSEELSTYNEALNTLNENLELRVSERTVELEKKNKTLSDYAFINSHELRKPVSNIIGLIQLFGFKLKEKDQSEILENLKKVGNDLDKMVRKIQSKLKQGKHEH